ncbi:hypothetical protein [Kitasatospora nipponensis]|uniref:hypothetical protein n=1 Tax=Kitasatospora nipponensis TaxID=258049 RepID=UPI0031DE6251
MLLITASCGVASRLPVDGVHPGTVLALLTLGGWTLGVLPVHSNRWLTGPERRLAAQPQPARGGVETPGLQERTQY